MNVVATTRMVYTAIVVFVFSLISSSAFADITQATQGDCSPAIASAGQISITCTFNVDNQEIKYSAAIASLAVKHRFTSFEVSNDKNIKSVKISLDDKTFYDLQAAPYVTGIQYYPGFVDFSVSTSELITAPQVNVYFRGCNEDCTVQFELPPLVIDVVKELSNTAKTMLSTSPSITCIGHKRYVSTLLDVTGFEGIEMIGYSLQPKSEIVTWFDVKGNVERIFHGEPPVSPAEGSLVVPPSTKRVYLTARFVDGSFVRNVAVTSVQDNACDESEVPDNRLRRRK
jgi:hypothetical protein